MLSSKLGITEFFGLARRVGLGLHDGQIHRCPVGDLRNIGPHAITALCTLTQPSQNAAISSA